MNKSPTFAIVSANVQGLRADRKRLTLFSKLAHSAPSIFLLSETGHPDALTCTQWATECTNIGLSSIFLPNNNTAILWRESASLSLLPSPSLTSSLSCPRYGRATDATFVMGNEEVTVVSVYIPVEAPQRKLYLIELSQALGQVEEGRALIVGGDWNVVEDPLLDSTNPTGANEGKKELLHLLSSNSLVDSFRLRNPRKRLTTNSSSSGTSRRLDRIYLSPTILPLASSDALWARPSDSTHNPIVLRLELPGAVEKGGGKFKLGLHVLQREGMGDYLSWKVGQLHSSSLLLHPLDPLAAWSHTKSLLLPHLKGLSRQLVSFDRHGLTPNEAAAAQESASIRARLDPSLTGASSVQIRLRQVRSADLIPSLQVNGQDISSADGILQAARDFYATLYEEKEIEEEALEQILGELEQVLSAGDAARLEMEYSAEEFGRAVRKCQRGSSPGPDGLPLEFFLETWAITGPILLSIINHIPSLPSSSLPPSEAHIHLIHKKGAIDDLSNKRPISLINAEERIISQAHNSRLAPLLCTIINPSQTGFIPGRSISTNIEQMQCAMDLGDSHPGLIASLDFEKAYDRLSHRYLDRVLEAVGVGPRARRWYAATYLNQSAKVFANGWLSLPLLILSGVRQGDPLAPSIFAIAIEAFACAIRKRVRGIQSTSLPILRESFFADDGSSGLDGFSDVANLRHASQLYERASGSRINNSKSFLYPLGALRGDPRPSCQGWRVERAPFRYLGVQVGVGVDREEEWTVARVGVEQRMRSIPMFDLPLATRCAIINRFCYSKILYLDRYSPASDATISLLSSSALATIWGRKHASISEERLKTPLDRGGFGLIDLRLQLRGPRAEWIYSLLPSSSFHTRYLRAIRGQLFLAAFADPRRFYSRDDPYRLASALRRWPGLALLCRPPPNLALQWHNAIDAARALLPPRWRSYLDAWNAFASLSPLLSLSAPLWREKALDITLQQGATIPRAWFRAPGSKEELSDVSFSRTTEACTLAAYGVIVPKGWESQYQLGRPRWKAWWSFLRKVRRRFADEEDTAHRFSLGSFPSGQQLSFSAPNPLFPNNSTPSCSLCLTNSPETHQHLLVDCKVACSAWLLGSGSTLPHPLLADFTCPVVSKNLLNPILFQVLFLHTILKLARRRRFGTASPLEPLAPSDVEQLGLDLAGAWSSSSPSLGVF